MLTACGIETFNSSCHIVANNSVATVLTACGIETTLNLILIFYYKHEVATVLTACGIETYDKAILI